MGFMIASIDRQIASILRKNVRLRSQAIKYLSLDIAEFVDKGPRINEVQNV
jgi:hypothetical protein